MYSIAHSHPSRSSRDSHSHLQFPKISHCSALYRGRRRVTLLQLFSWPQMSQHSTETANLPLLSWCWLSRGSLDTAEGSWAEKCALGVQLKQFGKAEHYDLTQFALIYFSSWKKKIPTQTPVFNFVNKSYWLWLWSLLQICSVQKRVSLLANSGMQLSSAGRTAESWFVFLATAQTLMGCPLRGGLPRESGLPWRQARC